MSPSAILLSGTSLSPWAYQRNYQLYSRELIRNIDPANYHKYNTSQTIYDYLQLYQGFFFAPVYEHEHDGAFLTKQAYEAMEEGDFNKVPLMSDHDFVKSVLKFAEQLVKHSQNPYLYQFLLQGVLGFHRNQSACGWRGSSLIQHH
ncbi:unnamed protein product [Acanthoscelides obtectus]|uniref:Uncharacterized protein n=1 Tax=Acanthoscelides obtectus TaxID=200917 RepID=A0A9P0VT70_ACAOB|nr:unnamed protein product [Acanthoscelides obtectus]CAK1689322.1 hypothetical protein AOBTE_LOCUS37163 [Acanthoscelides obtectus]